MIKYDSNRVLFENRSKVWPLCMNSKQKQTVAPLHEFELNEIVYSSIIEILSHTTTGEYTFLLLLYFFSVPKMSSKKIAVVQPVLKLAGKLEEVNWNGHYSLSSLWLFQQFWWFARRGSGAPHCNPSSLLRTRQRRNCRSTSWWPTNRAVNHVESSP